MLDPRLIMAGGDWDGMWMWMWTDVATPVNDEKARPKPTIEDCVRGGKIIP